VSGSLTGQCVRDPVANIKEQEGKREAFARDFINAPGGVFAVIGVVADRHLDGCRRGSTGSEWQP